MALKMVFSQLSALLVLVASLCPSKAQVEGEVRLTGLNSSHQGRVELYYDGEWGTLCDNDYGKASRIICYQLNYTSPPTSHWGRSFINLNESTKNQVGSVPENTTIHFWDVDCGPVYSDPISVLHILRCQAEEMNDDIQCTHDNDLVVFCDSDVRDREKPYNTQVRLVENGSGSNETKVNRGTLEIFLNNTWGNLCFVNFTQNDADTACRQLGYTNALSTQKEVSKTTGEVWVLNSNCNYSTDCMNFCFEPSKSVAQPNCSDGTFVGLTCTFNEELSDQLTSGNPIKCNYITRYSKVPAYFIGIMGGAFIQWVVTVTLIIVTAVCFTKETCPGYKYKHKMDSYITIQ